MTASTSDLKKGINANDFMATLSNDNAQQRTAHHSPANYAPRSFTLSIYSTQVYFTQHARSSNIPATILIKHFQYLSTLPTQSTQARLSAVHAPRRAHFHAEGGFTLAQTHVSGSVLRSGSVESTQMAQQHHAAPANITSAE